MMREKRLIEQDEQMLEEHMEETGTDTGTERDIIIQGCSVHLVFSEEPNMVAKERVRLILKDAYIRHKKSA